MTEHPLSDHPLRPAPRGRGALALLGACAVLAAVPASAHDGAKLYQQRCVQCHSVDSMADTVQRLGPDDAVRARLEALLPRHHAPDAEEREALVRHVLSLRPAAR